MKCSMTTEEAISIMNVIIHLIEPQYDTDRVEDAVNMAIKALEQQPCEDAISREAVDEYITNLLSGYLYDEERTRLEDLTAYIWELPSVTPKAERWIPCTERLPEDYEDVLVCDRVDMFVGWCEFDGLSKKWHSLDDNYDYDTPIIAWMPLPQPYKAESEDKEWN